MTSQPARQVLTGVVPADASRAPFTVTARCKGCGACLLTCPERAIRPRAGWAAHGEAPLEVRADLCTGCGECLEICPADAIEDPKYPRDKGDPL